MRLGGKSVRVIKNSKLRKILKLALICVLIPVTVVVGERLFGNSGHIYVSFAVAVLTCLLFLTGFDKREIGSRRAVIISVMTALSVIGRFIPFFKPVTALTIISGMYLGAESGFFVGAFSALISNFYFGQGPWTPYQMLAWGVIGLISGLAAKPLKKSRALLLSYGVISGALFSAVMDIWTVLWYNESFDMALYLGAAVTALPHTLLYAVSNFIFLMLMAKPIGEKLERINIKYGL